MITVEKALEIVLGHCPMARVEQVSLETALGRSLAEEVFADRDFPPFDRVTMDGIAIQYNAFQSGRRDFLISGVAPAGGEKIKLEKSDQCIEAMTGAILPDNCDVIIRYEEVTIVGNMATVNMDSIKQWQNIHFQGLDRKKDSLLLSPGKCIKAPEMGVLATAGKHTIAVFKTPKIAIISSGDELVNVDEIPAPYQIRKSNNYSISGILTVYNCEIEHFHLLDNLEAIKSKLSEILAEYDVIILSGGVSKGKFDYIPEALEQLNVEKLFHKVKQRPGKPFWFGVTSEGKPVFALPGNPVSSFMCANKYVVTWIQKHLQLETKKIYALLASDIHFKPDLNYFAQVSLAFSEEGKLIATPIEGNGSGDLANLAEADAFLELPMGKEIYKKGDAYEVIPFR